MANETTVNLASPTGTVSSLDNLIGTAGTPSANVVSVQGASGGTPVPVSLASDAVTNAGTFAVQNTAATPAGTNSIGSVTANAGTNLNTSALALEAGGNLAAILAKLTAFAAAASTALFSKITDGTNTAAVAPASTAPTATQPALVVAISPNSVNPNGQTTMAASAPVVIASNQSPIQVSPGVAGGGGGATNLHFFSVATTPAATAIKASAGTLYGVQAVNTGAAPAYLKLYNVAAASVTVGTTVPLMTIPVPTVATTGAGIVIPFPVGVAFSTAISWALTENAADADATAVAVGVTLNVQFA